ncbi:hypothetical protein [Ruegeria sp. HKCCD7255]|uniref:hypothetical protein n=1 Tax=Ruegeria sp. HKCCD7255 TaxID=2683004 RepID=UPI0014888623|nr:hypothetical protein [Ruegeria sp. HKCCD7255]
MELIADILLVAGALGAGLYCFVLARRLKRFTDLEQGVGGAVSVLSAQADELKTSLDSARAASDQSGAALQELTQRAEAVAQRLELMMASMHDLTPEHSQAQAEQTETRNPKVSQTVSHSNDTVDPAAPEKPEKPVGSTEIERSPGGLMFFRHAKPQAGPAK